MAHYKIINNDMNNNKHIDHWTNIVYLPYFMYATRSEAENKINGTIYKYIIRCCNDPAEFINGQPNPNMFVISYCADDSNEPGSNIVYRHTKFLRVPDCGITFSIKVTSTTKFFPTVNEMIANSSIYYIKPLE